MMEDNIRVDGWMTKCTGKDSSFGQEANAIRERTKGMKRMDLDAWFMKTAACTRETGGTGERTAGGKRSIGGARCWMEIGRVELL